MWFELYPAANPSHVLNGFAFALLGAYEYWQVTGDEQMKRLFEEGARTLERALPQYDLGYWSRYDLRPMADEVRLTFRLVASQAHPRCVHPIDSISLVVTTADYASKTVTLDVGGAEDANPVGAQGAHLHYAPGYQDWSAPYSLDGRMVRNYENLQGAYAHAPFDLKAPLGSQFTYLLLITYLDSSSESIFLEVHVPGAKYVRLAQLPGSSSGKWRCFAATLSPELALLCASAPYDYHQLHSALLRALHDSTGCETFRRYATLFAAEAKAMDRGLWWEDIRTEIQQARKRFGNAR